eukprot:TRINITY_DN9423_c0_g1_i11.p1 TRINITY_DN9423_c0_g1~~TRINITY_DN9423_c0_g1_i11.p1  ORF type:complete len:805 (-),score=252.92 TRINITY_DN9423_c0_g1_i11:26-2440(-)
MKKSTSSETLNQQAIGSVYSSSTTGHSSSQAVKNMLKEATKLYTLRITSPDLTLVSSVPGDWTVSQAIDKLRIKFPGDTSQYNLYVQAKKNGPFKLMNHNKFVAYYSREIEDPKSTVLFQRNVPDKTYSRMTSLFKLSEEKSKKSAEVISLKDMLTDAINKNDSQLVHSLLPNVATSQSSVTHAIMDPVNDQGQNVLHLAIRSNNSAIAKELIDFFEKASMNINLTDNQGWTPLHYAVSNDTGEASDEEILFKLLNAKSVQVDVANHDQNLPIHFFCQKFVGTSCQRLGEILISKSQGTINKKNKNGETPLHKAIFNPMVRVIIVKLLIKHGANTNIQTDTGGETPLHYAVRLGRKDLLKILLQAGANLMCRTKIDNKTPFELAIEQNEKEAIDILQSAHDLHQFLVEIQLGDHFQPFMKEELWLDTLVTADDNTIEKITKSMNITSESSISQLKEAVRKLADIYSKRKWEASLKKLTKQKFGSMDDLKLGNLKQAIAEMTKKPGEDDMDWHITHKDLEFTKELGSGTSATVFKGLLRGKKAAIKVLKSQHKDITLEDFKKEFHVMSALNSEYVVEFYGACLEPRICIVMEYCKLGSLYHVLKNESIHVGWPLALKFMFEMTAAINCLHSLSPPIFHRDLKSLNMLLTKDYKLKLSDFGTARFMAPEYENTMSKLCGTYSYASPELFFGKKYTEKCDIFSIAIILWELVVRVIKGKYEIPYSEFTNLKMDYQIFFHVAKNGGRVTIPNGTPPVLVDLITKCWDADPSNRPNSTELLAIMENVRNNYDENTTEWERVAAENSKEK